MHPILVNGELTNFFHIYHEDPDFMSRFCWLKVSICDLTSHIASRIYDAVESGPGPITNKLFKSDAPWRV